MHALKLAALASAALLSACVTTYGPAYQQARAPGEIGYWSQRVEENRYVVEYRAASSRDSSLAEDFAFRRAAELTLSNDYDWFQVIGRNRAISDRLFDRHSGLQYRDERSGADDRSYPSYRDDWRRGYGGDHGDSVAVLEIIMGNNPPPRSASVYAARRVLDQLGGDRYTRTDYDRRYDDRN
jgi:hypothetical protein